MDDCEILIRLQNREPEALEDAMQKYTNYVATIIWNKSKKQLVPMDIEEVTSDVFIALWNNSSTISSGHLKGWLSQVARNKTIDRLRKQRLEVPLDGCELLGNGTWGKMDDLERRDLIEHALSLLDPQLRELFYRSYILGQNSREIGKSIGMNPVTVRTNLLRGRKKLQRLLTEGGYFDESES